MCAFNECGAVEHQTRQMRHFLPIFVQQAMSEWTLLQYDQSMQSAEWVLVEETFETMPAANPPSFPVHNTLKLSEKGHKEGMAIYCEDPKDEREELISSEPDDILLNTASEAAYVNTTSKSCGHRCMLSYVMAKCCACEDKRKQATAYWIYVDGVGDTKTGNRNEKYCSACKALNKALIDLEPQKASAASFCNNLKQKRSKPAKHVKRRK
ncbi:hypothetical protein BC830DRAFT_263759 [Chytriomyces sp. MP71]|nr:hypothetical protein BC830DRAFT_263759 [Chytriomyces sp. MP71]